MEAVSYIILSSGGILDRVVGWEEEESEVFATSMTQKHGDDKPVLTTSRVSSAFDFM